MDKSPIEVLNPLKERPVIILTTDEIERGMRLTNLNLINETLFYGK